MKRLLFLTIDVLVFGSIIGAIAYWVNPDWMHRFINSFFDWLHNDRWSVFGSPATAFGWLFAILLILLLVHVSGFKGPSIKGQCHGRRSTGLTCGAALWRCGNCGNVGCGHGGCPGQAFTDTICDRCGARSMS
jgi:hypothetical protein